MNKQSIITSLYSIEVITHFCTGNLTYRYLAHSDKLLIISSCQHDVTILGLKSLEEQRESISCDKNMK